VWDGEATDAQVEQAAAAYVDVAKEVPDAAAALQGRATSSPSASPRMRSCAARCAS
jgi:hypothetical protein